MLLRRVIFKAKKLLFLIMFELFESEAPNLTLLVVIAKMESTTNTNELTIFSKYRR